MTNINFSKNIKMNFSVRRACIIYLVSFGLCPVGVDGGSEFKTLRTFVDEARIVRFHRLAVKCYGSVVGRTGDTVW